MARRKRKVKQAAGAPAWTTTFSDLMCLLLTFFILLFSMSQISVEKFSAASQSLQSALLNESGDSILEGNNTPIEQPSPIDSSSDDIPQEVHEMYRDVQHYIEEHQLESSLSLSRDEKGIYVDIQESILFDSGKATVKSDGEETLGLIAGLLNQFDNRVIVEGYTDDVPTTYSNYPTNWELSADRALSVLRYLSEEHDVAPTRLSAVGYGEYHPVVPNDTEENRARNRRVNIVLVHEPKEGTND